jgi:hypothetical protein
MPTYDYVCEANGRRVEVSHKMSEVIRSWGELCELARIEPGDTPREAAVKKLISGGAIIASSALSNPEPSCGTGGCAGGFCGLS